MFDHRTSNLFASRYVLFNEHVDEGHKVDNYDAWYIPSNYDENLKEVEDVEH